MADDISRTLMARIKQLEANQARILTTLSAIHAALDQLIPLVDQAPAPPQTASISSLPVPTGLNEGDQGALIDLVWDKFDMNADAYGFWHSAHAELNGRAPFEIAGTPEGDLAIRQLLDAIRDR
jgi:hypothetical protein